MVRAGLIWCCLVTTLSAATVEPKSPISPYRLVRVHLEPGERAWILSSSFEPVDAQSCTPDLIVWTGPPGRYAILTWTEASQSQQIVVIGGTPPPTPPDPDPPNPPGPDPPNPPDPPAPTTVLNEFGVGAATYAAAIKINRPAEAAVLATAARGALNKLVEGRITPVGAEAMVRTAREGVAGDWSSWEAAVEQAMQAAVAKYGGGSLRYRDYFLELAVAMETAAATKQSRQSVRTR